MKRGLAEDSKKGRINALLIFHPVHGEGKLVCIALSTKPFTFDGENTDSFHGYPLDGLQREAIYEGQVPMPFSERRTVMLYAEGSLVEPVSLGDRTFPKTVRVERKQDAVLGNRTEIERLVKEYSETYGRKLFS
ncbi:hypothetical protein HYS48_00265 [Candidatus Woesearchaeota archaeon]|nr:hypothetical protein [Candidatus Woesearchaeota archaeon]